MEVLLRRTIDKLGSAGDVVNVRPGYARNYLLPQGVALPVSKENSKIIETEREALKANENSRLHALREVAEKLADASVTIADKVSPEGHLYGSVTAHNIADALQAQGFEVTAKMVCLDEPIKELNVYEVLVRLAPDIEATCKVWVVSDQKPTETKGQEGSGAAGDEEPPTDDPQAGADS